MLVASSNVTRLRAAVALATLLVGDFVWLSLAVRWEVYPSAMFENPRLGWGALAWGALALSIAAGDRRAPPVEAAQWGTAVGAVTYAFFNGTELAVRKDYSPGTALCDFVWGAVLCTVASFFVRMTETVAP